MSPSDCAGCLVGQRAHSDAEQATARFHFLEGGQEGEAALGNDGAVLRSREGNELCFCD